MLEQHQSNSYNLEQIALILGGPQKILHDYLSSNDIPLNDDQLTQIEKIITSNPTKYTPKSLDETNDFDLYHRHLIKMKHIVIIYSMNK